MADNHGYDDPQKRYHDARDALRKALSLAQTYAEDGAPVSAGDVLYRACGDAIRVLERSTSHVG
jgi:hypothetical protein